MDLYLLGREYREARLIEGYTSLIWTERYDSCGDFELKSENVQKIMYDLPLNSCVAYGKSEEVMIVETQSINVDTNGKRSITVTGRTFESIYEDRVTKDSGLVDIQYGVWLGFSDYPAGYIADTLAYSAKLSADRASKIPFVDSYVLTGPIETVGQKIRRLTKKTDALSEVYKVAKENNLGIRTYRPRLEGYPMFTAAYMGNDLSDKIIFDAAQGHLEGNTRYVFSIKDYKNAVEVSTSGNSRLVKSQNTLYAEGLEYRKGYLDLGNSGEIPPEDLYSLDARGRAYLGEHSRRNFFDGKVSQNLPWKMYSDYDIGDIVFVLGEYGFAEPMRLAEFVTTEDENGENEYVTFEYIQRR